MHKDEKRKKTIKLRVNEDEYAHIIFAANVNEYEHVSEYVRDAALGKVERHGL